MYRPALAALALVLAGCSSQEPLARLSLKDPVPQPAVVKPVIGTADRSVSPVVVTGGTDTENRRLALEMFHGLNLAGHDIKQGGAWRITGHIDAGTVTWTITAPDGQQAGSIVQRNLTNPAATAIVPGVLTYLPRPQTRT